MEGELYYKAAIELTDKHPGTQFREMLGHDYRVSQLERLYFTGEYRGIELMGWNRFCLEMEGSGQGVWLNKIKALDNEVVLNHLEEQLMRAARDGKSPNRAVLEATVKALQGVSAVSKINTESSEGGIGGEVEVRFIPSLAEPIEPERLEKFLNRMKKASYWEGKGEND